MAEGKRTNGGEAGFAATDALVALTILATTVAFSLEAVETARRTAFAADETAQATQMLRGLLDARPVRIGTTGGQTPRFSWRVDTRAVTQAAAPGPKICGRAAAVTAVASRRRFALSTAFVCKVAT